MKTAGPSRRQGPPWWARDVLIGGVLSAALFGTQFWIDERRSTREAATAEMLASQADVRENVRFVRDRSSEQIVDRPFSNIDVRDSSLIGLKLTKADFRLAIANSTDFSDADLKGADFSGIKARDANFNGADLTSAKFQCRAGVSKATCRTDLRWGTWFGTNLTQTNFNGVDLTRSWFTADTIFDGTSFVGADLTESQLFDVDLSTTRLDNANLAGVCYSESTKWPPGFTPPPNSDAKTCH